jgi:hypothetical protein
VSNVFRAICNTVPVAQRWAPGKRLSGSLLNFHDTLMYLAWNFSTARFENIPNRVFADYRKMDPDSVKAAREQAITLGWIGCKPALRGTFTYWLLDPDGKPLEPVKEAYAREAWQYGADRWEKHLTKRKEPSQNSRCSPPADHRENSDDKSPTIGKSPMHRRETSDGLFLQSIENARVVEHSLPLKKPLKKEDSEGVALRSERATSETQCISPSWDEVGATSTRKVTKKEKKREVQSDKNGVVANANENAETKAKRTAGELLEHVAQDPVVQALAKTLGATIVDVVDLGEENAREKLPGGQLPADFWQRAIWNHPKAKAAPVAHKKFDGTPGKSEVPGASVRFVEPEAYTPTSNLGQPRQCRIHGVTSWWRRPGDSALLCDRCHPSPNDPTKWKEQAS